MTKIEEKYNERTGKVEVFLNDRRIDTLENDRTTIQLETLKNLLDLQGENTSLSSIKDVLLDIYNRIGDEQGEAIEKLKKELLFLIQLLDQKIESSKLVAGEGIVIDGNIISTTGGSYIDKLISDYEKLQQEYNKLLAENDILSGEVSVLKEQLERCYKERQQLIEELREMSTKYDKSLTTISKLNNEIKRLEEIIASGEDYKMYKKYEQLYYQAQAEARKWHQMVEDLSGDTKRKEIRNQELNNQLRNEFCRCCC